MRKTLITIIFTILLFIIPKLSYGAPTKVEFTATVKPSGGDYSTLSSAEDGLDYTGSCDLTSTSYLTAGYDGATGDPTQIIDAEAVTWDGGASSGNMIHVTTVSKSGADAFFIYVATGTLADNDVIDDGDGNTITVAGILGTAQITIEIDGDWTGVTDTTAVTIDGWTTDANHYIKVYTTTAARHSGVWDDTKYRLQLTATSSPYNGISIPTGTQVYIEGLQFSVNANGYNEVNAIYVLTWVGQNQVNISESIFKKTSTDTYATVGINKQGDGSVKIKNCIGYDFRTGTWARFITVGLGTAYVYNCTAYNNTTGFMQTGGTFIAKNNLSYNNTDNYSGTFNASSTNNLSGPSQTDAPGSNPRNAATVTFADADGDDFHLALSDLGARGYGLSQYTDVNLPVTTDIDANYRRPNAEPTDIGVDEDIDLLDGDDVRISEIKESGARYSTLSGWESDRDGTTGDITGYYPEIAQIDGSWTNPDTTAVTIDGWTTDTDHYIKVYTTTAARHSGVWDTGKWRMEIANEADNIYIKEPYTVIDGLQIKTTSGSYNYRRGIYLENNSPYYLVTGVVVKNNIVRKGYSGGSQNSVGIGQNPDILNPNFFYNNIIYDFTGTGNRGISLNGDGGTRYSTRAYNNTVHNCTLGFGGESVTYKNNIAQNCTDGFSAWGTSHDYNISDISGDTTGYSPSYRSGLATDVTFADADNDDFHLASNDAGARNYGTDLSADGNLAFQDDIDGGARPGESVWDIGADETAKYAIGRLRGIIKMMGDIIFK